MTTGTTGALSVPQPRTMGSAQVPTGFPHSSSGALAQLVAIDQRALESASVVTAQDVIAGWAEPGGPTRETWSGVKAVVALLSSAGLPADGAGTTDTTDTAGGGEGGGLQVQLRPAMGFIKGVVGEDFVVPCVDFVATITPTGASAAGTAATRIAVADCQRMVWAGGRWRIGAGSEPVASPSLWPGTKPSYDAGYQWLETTP